MSVEIEVGFENATKVPRLTEELSLEETPKGLANPKVRQLLLGGGAVVLLVVVGRFAYYRNRGTKDDAQVDGHITPMGSKEEGRVEQGFVGANQAVQAAKMRRE